MINRKSLKIGIVSIAILASLTIAFLPGLMYFYFLPLIILIIFLILIWLTNYKIYQKLIFTIVPILIIPICVFISEKLRTIEPETFIIPENYRGKVRIVFNQKCGVPIKYENNRRIYEIPTDGILLTQFKDEQGIVDYKFYLLEKGQKREIQQLLAQDFNEEWTFEKNPNEPPRNKLAIFHAGTTYSDGSSEFYICTYNELKNYDFKYDSKFDSILSAKQIQLRKYCR